MGWNVGIPSLKLNNVGKKSKHCGSFAGVVMEALEERKGRDPDIDPELAHLNIYEGITSAKELIEYSRKHVQELSDQLRAAGGRKIREDAVVMCSTIVKPPAEMMATLSRDDQIRFLQDAVEKLAEVIGEENIKSKAYHFDEQGGHVHVIWEPMTEDGRLCAKELHDIKFFGRLNREMPEHLRSRGWDIEDCNCYDAAKEELEKDTSRTERKESGRSSAAYKRDMQRQTKALQREMDELTEDLQLIKTYDQYRSEALEIHQTIDMAEAATKELSEAPKIFKASAAQRWTERILTMLQDIRKLIETALLRLKIFERKNKVEERLSEPVQERKLSLDAQIAAATKAAQKAAEMGPTPKKANSGTFAGGGVGDR